MKYKFLLNLLVILNILFLTGCKNEKAVCPFDIKQLPQLHGFSLGMRIDDIRKLFPRITIKPPNEFGITRLTIVRKSVGVLDSVGKVDLTLSRDYAVDPVQYPEFKDIYGVRLELLDGKVTQIGILYPKNDLKMEEFKRRIKETYKLPNMFLEDGGINCDGFKINTLPLSYSINPGVPNTSWYNIRNEVGFIFHVSDTTAENTLSQREKKKEDAERAKELADREKKVREFKP